MRDSSARALWAGLFAAALVLAGGPVAADIQIEFIPSQPLLKAVRAGDVAAIRNLLATGMSAGVEDIEGRTALMYAAAFGMSEIADLLIANGADVDATDNRGATALMEASRHGRDEIVEQLLRAGAKVDAEDRTGRTALMLAAAGGHLRAVEQLLRGGADRERADYTGRTAADWVDLRAPRILRLLRAGH